MNLFYDLTNIFKESFNIKKLKQLKNKQTQIIELNDQLIEKCDKIDNLSQEVNSLIDKNIKVLNKQDFHKQNLSAKRLGLKSGMQYKIKLNKQQIDNRIKRENALDDKIKHLNNIEENKKELTKIKNTILCLTTIRFSVILSFLISMIITSGLLFFTSNLKITSQYPVLFFIISNIIIFALCLTINIIENYMFSVLSLKKIDFFLYYIPFIININVTLNLFFYGYIINIITSFLMVFMCIFNIAEVSNLLNKVKDNEKYFPDEHLIIMFRNVFFAIIVLLINNNVNNSFKIFNSILLCVIFIAILISYIWHFISIRIKFNKQSLSKFISFILSFIFICILLFLTILSFTGIKTAFNYFGTIASILAIMIPVLQVLYTNKNSPLE